MLDPGFGLGRTLEDNYLLLARLKEFCYLYLPLLFFMSRKSMIGNLLNISINKYELGSVVCAVVAALHGVKIIRAHNVKKIVEAMRIVEAILSTKAMHFNE